MRRMIGGIALASVLAALPGAARAQHRAAETGGAHHELGADLTFQYSDRGAGIGGGAQLLAPVDVRIGFLARSPLMFEGRAAVNWDTKAGAGGGSFFELAPGVNALYRLRRGSGPGGLVGAPYLTGGLLLDIVHDGALGSQTQFVVNAGVGTRVPYESAVFRPEAFLAYGFASGFLPRAFMIGVRAGLSFWH